MREIKTGDLPDHWEQKTFSLVTEGIFGLVLHVLLLHVLPVSEWVYHTSPAFSNSLKTCMFGKLGTLNLTVGI